MNFIVIPDQKHIDILFQCLVGRIIAATVATARETVRNTFWRQHVVADHQPRGITCRPLSIAVHTTDVHRNVKRPHLHMVLKDFVLNLPAIGHFWHRSWLTCIDLSKLPKSSSQIEVTSRAALRKAMAQSPGQSILGWKWKASPHTKQCRNTIRINSVFFLQMRVAKGSSPRCCSATGHGNSHPVGWRRPALWNPQLQQCAAPPVRPAKE